MDPVEELVDLERYPVITPDSDSFRAVVAGARRQLADTGRAELSGFLNRHGVDVLVADAESLAPRAHHSKGRGTAYLARADDDLAPNHPRRWTGPYAVGAVAYDIIPRTSALRRLYEWDPLLGLVAAVLDRGPLYRYADAFGALNLAVMGPGDELQWHFDQTDFVVSLAIQSAAHGGDFEVAPLVRSPHDERYDAVAAVLGGDHRDVITLPMTPGTLLVFEGRHSLHRVSPVSGERIRHVGLFAYDTAPGTVGTSLLHHARYGREVPEPEPPDDWVAA